MGKRLVNGKTSPAQVVDELHDAPAQCRRAAQGTDECDGLHSQVLLRGFSVLYRGCSPKKRTVKCCAGRPWMRQSTRRLSGPMLWRTRRRKIDAIGGIVPPICLNLTFIFGQPAEILKISPPALADPKMGCYTRPISANRDASAHGRFILCYTKDRCVVSAKKLL